MKKIDLKKLIIAFSIVSGLVLISMILTKNTMSLYEEMVKPNIAPPPLVFPIVWSILYLLIGIWYHFFEINASKNDKIIYYFGLLLNFMFSPVLFYFHNIPFAFLITILLLVINIYLLFKSVKQSKTGYLLLPYLLWLVFANILMIDLLVNNVL